ncbi:MAG: hypothetical protein QGI83_13925 [Candidatus Latescibacteria bacterium]|nr:hypothetical protein [Candidatus Latescibacterota bacterium]
MLPTVDFFGHQVTRLILGANPFGGYSHQTPERNEEMRSWHTPDRIVETWKRAEAAGINTIITNNESPNVMEALDTYFSSGGTLQWIAQVSPSQKPSMEAALDDAAAMGAKAMYTHGAYTDRLYKERDADQLKSWMECIRSHGIPGGVAGHHPEVHDWAYGLGFTDFHAVCFFQCGSVHEGRGLKFKLGDAPQAAACTQRIEKPCIAYKIMGSGRIDAEMGFDYALENIKPTDVMNVGMHRGDKDDMVEENVAIVKRLLGC